MSYRYMRIIVMFDLPMDTAVERKDYAIFRKYLIKSGFLMLQKSVYCKLAQNSVAAESLVAAVRRNKPKAGLVQVLTITEKQYSKMEYIIGTSHSEVIDSDERLLIL